MSDLKRERTDSEDREPGSGRSKPELSTRVNGTVSDRSIMLDLPVCFGAARDCLLIGR